MNALLKYQVLGLIILLQFLGGLSANAAGTRIIGEVSPLKVVVLNEHTGHLPWYQEYNGVNNKAVSFRSISQTPLAPEEIHIEILSGISILNQDLKKNFTQVTSSQKIWILHRSIRI